MPELKELFDLRYTAAAEYLGQFTHPWQALEGIEGLIRELGAGLGADYLEVSPQVWVHRTASVAPTAYLGAPCIIGAGTEVRHCAFIRGSALVGAGCVVGNSVELKNVILFDHVQVCHFNYVGDSILGHCAHMGAGSVTSNVRGDQGDVSVRDGGEKISTGLWKCGAFIGDHAEVGCNAVLNPGTVLGRNSQIYPTSCVRGPVPEGSIWTNDGTMVKKV